MTQRCNSAALGSALIALCLSGCGAEAAVAPPPADPAPPPPPPPVEETPEPVAEAPVEEPEPEPEPPPPPPPEPVVVADADALRPIMEAAARDVETLRRFIDLEQGIGVWDPEAEGGPVHHCDMDHLAALPGLGFVLAESDRFRCNRDLSRCTLQSSEGGGQAFYFRRGEGGRLLLTTMVRYPRRVPGSDSRAIREFAEGGDGVCDLRRALGDQDHPAPAKLSVFVSEQTGLVPETLAAHYCGDLARTAYAERVAPVLGRDPERCTRAPTRCVFESTETHTTVYGGSEGIEAITIIRPGMHRPLERAQQRDLDAFMRARSRNPECFEPEPEPEPEPAAAPTEG